MFMFGVYFDISSRIPHLFKHLRLRFSHVLIVSVWHACFDHDVHIVVAAHSCPLKVFTVSEKRSAFSVHFHHYGDCLLAA